MAKFWTAAIIGGMMLFSGCTNQSYTTKELQEAERRSRDKAVEIQAIYEKVRDQVDLFNGVFSRYKKEEIASAVPELYAEDAFLNDRIHSVTGNRAIAEYFDGTFEKMHKSEFHIHDTTFAKHDVYIRWTMRIQLKEGDKFMEFLGMSQFRFNEEGRIIYHQDYWDFSELMGEIRFVRSIVNYVKGRA
jgi:limonene-1,2-epoxide hydrolase